jgi:acetylornithine deacetylase/succinyl-diaminopimelate desuccinylase-like protein
MQETLNYINENKQRFVDELFELLRIPSISADPAYKDDVLKCADVCAEHLRNAGADNVEVCETKGYPIVFGEKIIDTNLPTVLVYGHYDVQPADPLEFGQNLLLNLILRKLNFILKELSSQEDQLTIKGSSLCI